MLDVETAPEAVVIYLLLVFIAIILYRLGKGDGEIGIIRPRPAVGNPIPCQQGVILDAEACPEDFPVVIVDTVSEVED